MKERTNKTITFAHYDAYEHELWKYATDPARGKFGPYIKRLIERDRDGVQAHIVASPTSVSSNQVAAPAVVSTVDKAAVAAFL